MSRNLAPSSLLPSRKTGRRAPAPVQPLRIVAMGGGNGLSAVLKGLRDYVAPSHWTMLPGAAVNGSRPVEITAVVTVTDDGGSSGRLRRDFAILPPGDIRNCLVSLAEDQALMSQLFQYRFGAGRGLKGHSFGNLFLTALARITGDFHQAVQFSSEVLAIRGKILPSTMRDVRLEAELEDGDQVAGESRIGRSRARISRIRLSPARCEPLPETLQAIEAADLITLGPGSLYTSVIPHLLIDGIARAIARSSAIKAYICNLMWQPGETIGYSASDHVQAIEGHSRNGRRRFLDYVVVNSRKVPAPLACRYARQHARQVEVDMEALQARGVQVLAEDLLAAGRAVRHEPRRLAQLLVTLAELGRRERAVA